MLLAIAPLVLTLSGTPRAAAPVYYGIYLRGTIVGYSKTTTSEGSLEGKSCRKRSTHLESHVRVLGASTQAFSDTTSWLGPDSEPVREDLHSQMGQVITTGTVWIGAKKITFDMTVAGKRSKVTVPRPAGYFLDDCMPLFSGPLHKPGSRVTGWDLDEASFTTEKVTVENRGPSTYLNDKTPVHANLLIVYSGKTQSHVYANDKGDVLRIDHGTGTTVDLADAEIVALQPGKDDILPDLAVEASLKSTQPINNAEDLNSLKLAVTGEDLSDIPSDDTQTLSKDGDGWIIDVHPVQPDEANSLTIAEAGKNQKAWLGPSQYIPSANPKLKALAAKIVNGQTNAAKAAVSIMKYVFTLMQPQMGVGEGRDAMDILKQQTGKCTDYAILTAALLRAAGIPAQIACGWVTGDGTFFYHAWNMAWDGNQWINLDSTIGTDTFPANHIKLAQGEMNKAEQIVFPFNPSDVKIDVLSSSYN